MDPDVIFLILLYFTLLIFAIGSIIGLTKKIWKASFSKTVKLVLIGLVIILLLVEILIFSSARSTWVLGLFIFFPSFLISLNWSVNIIRTNPYDKIKLPINTKIIILTILFTVVIPTMFFLIGTFFDKLNLMGSG
jgi:hypothetical protein